MGCDIHIYYEKKKDGEWVGAENVSAISSYDWGSPIGIDLTFPFDWRSYNMFSWLCQGVRDYSGVLAISSARGLPHDVSDAVMLEAKSWEGDSHNESFLYVEEIANYKFKEKYRDRCGDLVSAQEFFGNDFFKSIEELKKSDCERIVFWFDN